MLAPYSWLKDYVEINISPKELADKMTMSGTKVERVEHLGQDINKVVVGKILEINKHPNADRLLVTKVNVGSEVVQIVTGAKNIKEGDYIPVALVGSTLPGGVEIKKSKLRGIESFGMMCSAQELSLNIKNLPEEQIQGIYIFNEELPIGKDVKEVLGLNEIVFEFELTNNRPDCMSVVGLSREIAATLNKPLNIPGNNPNIEENQIKNYTSIEVLDDNCTRFIAGIIKDVKIGQSPKWMQDRLARVGVRSINNIVDVTNYVMMEMGQPLHAYDYNKLTENRIIVRKAYSGEKLITLDGIKRELDPSMLVIADAKKPLGIAGVMGGGNSEVDDNTNIILLEAANFEKDSVRHTAKRIGLRTEASTRYEKGIDPNLAILAINRACQLLEEINAGIIVEGFIDIYPNPLDVHYIEIDPIWVNRFIGIDISKEQMAGYLESLGMKVELLNQILRIKIPTFRQDLKLPEDIAEEIARLYGYDNIPSTLMSGITVQGIKTYKQKLEDRIKNLLVGQGGYEICTYSFISPQSLDKLNIPDNSVKREILELINPLGEENSIMRTTLISSMLEVISHNISHDTNEAFLFEMANTYHPTKSNTDKLPIEDQSLCLGLFGDDVDFFDIKGIVENILSECGISQFEFERLNSPTFHPGRSTEIIYQGETLGVLGEIHPDVGENYNIPKRIYIGEFNFDLLSKRSNLSKEYRKLPKYPSVNRDIAIQIKEEIPVREIEKIIEKQNSTIIESFSLFDIYKGEQIPEGYKSVAYSIVYRNSDRTLTDKEVDKVHNKIVADLENNMGASLRE